MGCVYGYTVIVGLGINAHSKDEAKKIAQEWIKPMDCPIWVVRVEK